MLETVNDEEHGLGVALPSGGIAVFEPSSYGPLLVGEERLRDYASGQDVEIALGRSDGVQVLCSRLSESDAESDPDEWTEFQAEAVNALPLPVQLRLVLGWSDRWTVRQRDGLRIKDGERVIEVTIPANSERKIRWRLRPNIG